MEAYKGIRGQSEVIGLLVIVIILVFLGLIYLGFSNIAQSVSYGDERTSIEAENALKALMKVNIEGYDEKTLEDMIVDCGNDVNKCEILEMALEMAYSVILKPGTEFSFFVQREGEEVYAIGNCDLGLFSSYTIVENGVVYEAKLKLCE